MTDISRVGVVVRGGRQRLLGLQGRSTAALRHLLPNDNLDLRLNQLRFRSSLSNDCLLRIYGRNDQLPLLLMM